ncbi:MAG: hypothetical protein PHD46_02150 [Eubacteriales bacterium]|nr:hypothetical protein [Eubacteriales bacterium]MDD4421818.1 hypothetical protein [Eubacteriales bacterium]HBR30894.1 hypothetical protein [Clostridiales bacterium]
MKKKELLRTLKIIFFVFAAIGLICLLLYVVSILFLADTGDEVSNEFSFYVADYEENIFEDEVYLSKIRNVYYLEYGSGDMITESNIGALSNNAKFFDSYFDIVINGEYGSYKNFFTKKYLEKNKIPEKFTMQKLYDISVDLYDKKTITEDNNSIMSYTFIVRYKIFENNGTFRSDVGSNMIRPLVFMLYETKDGILINDIYYKKIMED